MAWFAQGLGQRGDLRGRYEGQLTALRSRIHFGGAAGGSGGRDASAPQLTRVAVG